MSLRVIFMGTPEYAVPALKSIVKAGHQVVAVYSQPPRPSGRGHKLVKSAVHQVAEELGIPVYTPVNFRDEITRQEFADLDAEVAVVAVYGLLLPKAVLDSPRYGCINIHASLLPRWRGAAPIQRAILAGDHEIGVTIMQMDVGLDTGDMLMSDMIPITGTSTSEELHDRIFEMGSHLIVEVLHELELGDLVPQEQPEEGVTYADKLQKDEGQLFWSEPAEMLERKVRALNPNPGVWFNYRDARIKVLAAEIAHLNLQGQPGEVMDDQLTIACGRDFLRLLEVQKPGGRAMAVKDFLNGTPIRAGDKLE